MNDEQEFHSFIERQAKLEALLAEYDAFMQTGAFLHFVSSRRFEIENLRADIVDNAPTDRPSEIESYKRRGDLRTTIDFETIFEDTAADLKIRLRQMDEEANPSQQQPIENNDDETIHIPEV